MLNKQIFHILLGKLMSDTVWICFDFLFVLQVVSLYHLCGEDSRIHIWSDHRVACQHCREM